MLSFIFATTRSYKQRIPRTCLCCILYHGSFSVLFELLLVLCVCPELPLLPAIARSYLNRRPSMGFEPICARAPYLPDWSYLTGPLIWRRRWDSNSHVGFLHQPSLFKSAAARPTSAYSSNVVASKGIEPLSGRLWAYPSPIDCNSR